jgi:NAD(P)-dependent dehydrogenase (short-subunit alcohol dehydrogenase family)
MLGNHQTSVDGYELTMASNHLGHFLLTQLLIPFLRRSKDPRIIQVTSSTYVLANKGIDLEDLFCTRGRRKYTLFGQYAQSKLANILFSLEFHRRELQHPHTHPHIAIFNVHPGLVRTDVVRNMPWYLKYPNTVFGFVLALLQKTPEAGAYTSTYCATSPGLQEKSGCYFVNSTVVFICIAFIVCEFND